MSYHHVPVKLVNIKTQKTVRIVEVEKSIPNYTFGK